MTLDIQFLVFSDEVMGLRPLRLLRLLRPPRSLRPNGLQIFFFHYDYINLEHFEFFEAKETIWIIEAGEVAMALEVNEVIESFKIGCDASIQYFNDKQ